MRFPLARSISLSIVCLPAIFFAGLAATLAQQPDELSEERSRKQPGQSHDHEPEPWPAWRGPTRDGLLPPRPWPAKLQGDGLRTLWRVDGLGPSYSGPIVGGGRVFVTETRDEKEEVVRALDRATGKELWVARWEGALRVPFFAASNGSWIRSTPALDGDRLYVAGMRDRLVCLDAATGAIEWNVDFMERYKTILPAFGFVCSPLLVGDGVFVQAGASLLRLEKKTGETTWRSLEDEGGMFGSAFSSPVLARIAGADQILVQTRTKLAGVGPEDGRVLWSRDVPAFRGMNILTPVSHDAAVFTSSYGGGSFLFRVARKDEAYEVAEAWTDPTQGYMSTPLLIAGRLYLHLRSQRLVCFDWATGEKRWTSTERFGRYMSLVSQGDRILGLDERGELVLFAANPDRFELLDTRKVSAAPTWAHLAVSGPDIFVRELNAIAAFRWQEPPPG